MPPKAPCSTCLDALALPSKGLKGLLPLPWFTQARCAQLLLQVRQLRQGKALSALVQLLSDSLTLPARAMLVPIPSWKRQRSNPLPQRIALGLGRPKTDLLHRTHAGVSQHHLNKRQRQTKMMGTFQASPLAHHRALCSLWLVDDILTTGSTAWMD